MNLLDRHIFFSVLFTCAATIGLFAFVVALPNVMRDLLEPLLAGQISLETFARLVALLLPFVISYALPMGTLAGVLVTLGRLAADGEITAMRASGISMLRIARPVLLFGALCATTALHVNFESMPRARVQYHKELSAAVRTNPLHFIVPKTFIRDFSSCVLYVGEKDGTVLRDIWLWELDDQRRVRRVVRAQSGSVVYDDVTNSLVPTLMDVKIEERDANNPEDYSKSPKVATIGQADQLRIPLERHFGANRDRMKDEWLTYCELRQKQAVLAAGPTCEYFSDLDRERVKTSLIIQEKFNRSLAVFSFALIGVPLGIKVSRRETSANLGLALLLVLGFYLLTLMIKWLDRHPELHPDLLMWLPNLLVIWIAAWLFSRVNR